MGKHHTGAQPSYGACPLAQFIVPVLLDSSEKLALNNVMHIDALKLWLGGKSLIMTF